MRGGILLLAVVSASGCAAPMAKTTAVHPMGVSPVPVNGSAGERVAYADAQLALGNVALALEAYRRASRQDTDNVRALVGTAQCYDAMGRFDLARRTYESALALAPADIAILARLAVSLSQSGDQEGAAQLRREMAVRASSSITVALPSADRDEADSITPTSNTPAIAAELTDVRRVERPYLERLSLGEVALVTAGPVRWADLRSTDGPGRDVRILNAARRAGLAARTRNALLRLGWRELSIGNAAAVRESSLIFYPAGRRRMAEQLARQVGATMVRPSHGSEFVMLLGRDLAANGFPGAAR